VTPPDRPPVPGQHSSHWRDYEYQRLGTVSLLAGLDLHTGRIVETVSDTPNSADFIAFLKKLAYPAQQTIRLIWDHHSAHISKETRSYLDTVPQRFVFVFTPPHGSWLNLIENQQDDHAARKPRGQQARADRTDPAILRGDQFCARRVSLELQDGRDLHCIVIKRTMISLSLHLQRNVMLWLKLRSTHLPTLFCSKPWYSWRPYRGRGGPVR
jgi:hypothetical protein